MNDVQQIPKPQKHRIGTIVHAQIPTKHRDELESIAADMGVTMSVLLRLAVKEWLDRYHRDTTGAEPEGISWGVRPPPPPNPALGGLPLRSVPEGWKPPESE